MSPTIVAAVPIVYLGQEHFAELWHKCHMRGAVFEGVRQSKPNKPSDERAAWGDHIRIRQARGLIGYAYRCTGASHVAQKGRGGETTRGNRQQSLIGVLNYR